MAKTIKIRRNVYDDDEFTTYGSKKIKSGAAEKHLTLNREREQALLYDSLLDESDLDDETLSEVEYLMSKLK